MIIGKEDLHKKIQPSILNNSRKINVFLLLFLADGRTRKDIMNHRVDSVEFDFVF